MLFATVAVVALLAPRAGAAGADTEACVAASDRAQVLRDEGKLREARARFIDCGVASCPAVIQKDCASWLAEVSTRIPTVVFSVRDPGGNDVSDVRVSLGDELLASRIDGRSVPVDPGEWTFRFVRSSGEEVSKRVIVREGEQGRLISVELPRRGREPEGSGPSAGGDRVEPAEPSPATSSRPVPLGTWIFSGVAIAGIAGFTYFWLSAVRDAKDLATTCEPRCTDSDLDGPRTKALVADVSLGVGVASALTAAAFYLLRPGAPAVGVAPLKSGAVLTASGGF